MALCCDEGSTAQTPLIVRARHELHCHALSIGHLASAQRQALNLLSLIQLAYENQITIFAFICRRFDLVDNCQEYNLNAKFTEQKLFDHLTRVRPIGVARNMHVSRSIKASSIFPVGGGPFGLLEGTCSHSVPSNQSRVKLHVHALRMHLQLKLRKLVRRVVSSRYFTQRPQFLKFEA